MHVAPDTSIPPAGPKAPPPLVDTPEARDALSCPLCGYSLRGLAPVEHPQCPECGYRFEWVELLGARQYTHPYLFEHNPRRNVRSFVGTLGAGMRPRRFWASLNAGHAVRPGRLLAYWVGVALLVLLTGFAGSFAANAVTQYRQAMLNLVIMPGTARPAFLDWGFLGEIARTTFDDHRLETFLVPAALAWPWLTVAALLLFQSSMRRAKVLPGHVMRCAVYGGDVFVWTGVLFLLLGVLRWLDVLSRSRMWDSMLEVRQTAACFLVLPALMTYRVGVAYRRYLRFDRPWATVVASQVLVLLLVVTMLSFVYPYFWMLMP